MYTACKQEYLDSSRKKNLLPPIALDHPAVDATAQVSANKLPECRKPVANLHKKIDLLSKMVSDYLFTLLCSCASLLQLPPTLLKILVLDTVETGWCSKSDFSRTISRVTSTSLGLNLGTVMCLGYSLSHKSR